MDVIIFAVYSLKLNDSRFLSISPRARNRFNQVVDAKRIEGKSEKCTKIKLLKHRLVHKSAMCNGIHWGRRYLKIALKWGTL